MEKASSKKYEIDMCNGPLLGKIMIFYVPLMLSGILQLLFNAADIVVVGRFAGNQALAAVGSTGSLTNLLVNIFIGLSVGANVLVARYYGAKQDIQLKEMVQTAIATALAGGIILIFLGFFLARPALGWMGTPDDVISHSVLYMRIYFAGMPFMMVYNFGSAVFRSVGDTKLPFYSLLVATLCNLVLDWVFVAVFDMGVAGVAWGTVISNGVNAAIIVFFLTREAEPVTLSITRWSVSVPDLKKMLQIGVPAGLQGMVFSVSNIFIQSAINRFGADAIAGSSAALTYEAYCYYVVVAFCAATIAFAGQNYGAGLYDRCKRVAAICMFYSVAVCGVANFLIVWQQQACIGVFTSDAAVVHYASVRFHTVLVFQSLASSYEIAGAYMRGLGYSLTPMLLTVFGTCVLRLGWVYLFPRIDYSFRTLMVIYPVTWAVTGLAVITAAVMVQRKAFALKGSRAGL